MRSALKFLKNRHKNLFWYNFYWHLWFSYHSVFFCSLIFRGKKVKAFNNFLKIKQGLKLKEKFDPFLIFLVSMMKITPNVVLVPLKNSGLTQGVPFPITAKKQVTFAVKWVLKLLKDTHRVVQIYRVVDLLVSAIYNRGNSIKKKQEVYKKASLNRHLIKFFK